MDEPALAGRLERLLAQRLCAGDETALAEIYDQFSSFVYGLALKVIGDRSAAEDVAQEVFVSLWEQPERFDAGRGSMRAYLGTLTHRRSVDLIRREEARRRRETKTSAEPLVGPRVDDTALATLTSDEVRVAVASLPPTSARRSSWPTSRATPTGRWRRRSASPRARPSHACAWRWRASRSSSLPT